MDWVPEPISPSLSQFKEDLWRLAGDVLTLLTGNIHRGALNNDNQSALYFATLCWMEVSTKDETTPECYNVVYDIYQYLMCYKVLDIPTSLI